MIEKKLPECPIETALQLFGEKWKFLILRELLTGTKRFKDLRSAIDGISDRMLSLKVTALIEDGLVKKEVYHEMPPRVEYSLTQLGGTLTEVFESLYCWGEMYQDLTYSGKLLIEKPKDNQFK